MLRQSIGNEICIKPSCDSRTKRASHLAARNQLDVQKGEGPYGGSVREGVRVFLEYEGSCMML